MRTKSTQAFVGLRSGGVLVVSKGEGGVPEVNADQVTLDDVAFGLVGQNRFANQLFRQPYTVLEHSLLGTYLFDDIDDQIAYMFHDSAEGFGVCDLNWKIKLLFGHQIKRVEAAILEALAKQFNFSWPMSERIKPLDRMLGAYELVTLHPAAAAVAQGYGFNLEELKAAPSAPQRATIDRWFNRPPQPLNMQREMWTDRLKTLRMFKRETAVIREEVGKAIYRPGFLPYLAPLLPGAVAHLLRLGSETVRREIERLEGQGVLVRRDSYYHLAESPSNVPVSDAG